MKDLTKKNILKLKQSSTLVINEKCKELLNQGKVYQFGLGQSPFPVPKIVETLKDNAHRKVFAYTRTERLRNAISKYLKEKTGINYPKENIVITPGSKEAMLLLHVAFNGEIILSAPSWVSYEPQAIIGRNKVHWIQTSRENNWLTAKQSEKKSSL